MARQVEYNYSVMNQDTKIIAVIGIITVLIIGVSLFFLGDNSGGSTSSQQQQDVNANVPANSPLLVRSDSFKISSPSAKVTVVEFADYECPACAEDEPGVQQILKDYNGKINYVFRNFPLPQHQNAIPAAMAVEAAGEQGKFLEMGAKLFSTQATWVNLSNPNPVFVSDAQAMGLNMTKFNQDLQSQMLKNRIQKDYEDATALKIEATPTFFVNGQRLTGADYNTLKQTIDQDLSK